LYSVTSCHSTALKLSDGTVDLTVEHGLVANDPLKCVAFGEVREVGGVGAMHGRPLFRGGQGGLKLVDAKAAATEHVGDQVTGLLLGCGAIQLEDGESRHAAKVGEGVFELGGLVGGEAIGGLVEQFGETLFEGLVVSGVVQILAEFVDFSPEGVGSFEESAQGADLEALNAAESPEAGGDAFHEGLFDEITRLQLDAKVGEESVEVLLTLVGVGVVKDDVAGQESVLEGVARGAGFAGGRCGTRGPGRVAAVRETLLFGNTLGHDLTSYGKNVRGARR